MSVVLSVCKGRSKDPRLNVVLMRLSAYVLAVGLRLVVRWVPSELNLADPGSRVFEAVRKPVPLRLRHLAFPRFPYHGKGGASIESKDLSAERSSGEEEVRGCAKEDSALEDDRRDTGEGEDQRSVSSFFSDIHEQDSPDEAQASQAGDSCAGIGTEVIKDWDSGPWTARRCVSDSG
eukprot:5845964-Karenia_brevis.AAC.1